VHPVIGGAVSVIKGAAFMSTGTARPVLWFYPSGTLIRSHLPSSVMPGRSSAAFIATWLGVQERVLLFCLTSGTDWTKVPITQATAQHLLVRGLIDRDQGAGRFKLTPLGRDVLAALLKPPVDEQDG
jgi:hypothetical protein